MGVSRLEEEAVASGQIGRPRVIDTMKNFAPRVWIDADLCDALNQHARFEGKTKQGILRRALQMYAEEYGLVDPEDDEEGAPADR
jgi:hypothetical protein